MIVAAGSLHAALSFWHSLSEIEQTADLIVVGAAGHGAQAANGLSFTIQVDRVVKGDPVVSGNAITVNWAYDGQGNPAAITGSGLWFLKSSAGGWVLLPIVQGGIGRFADTFIAEPAGPILSAYAYEPGASLSDRVASEVSAAIESADGGGAQLSALHDGILLDGLGSPVLQVLYGRMTASNSKKQHALGLAGQIRSGNSTALSAAAQAAPSFAAFALENGVLLNSVEAWFRAADPASVAILGRIVDDTGGNLRFRRAAAFALAAIHTKEALPYLAALVADDDPELRAEFVRGVGSFANGLPVQTMAGTPSLSYLQPQADSRFRTNDTIVNHPLNIEYIEENESKYLSFWKAWWATHRVELGY